MKMKKQLGFSIQTPSGPRMIGPGHPCFIVAEISANHIQKYKKAEALIDAAADAGADAIKLQTYTPDTMTIPSTKKWFMVRSSHTPRSWRGTSLYELYKTAYTPWEWHAALKKRAERRGLVFFSTPFDSTALRFLVSLRVPIIKVASYEATDIPLLQQVAKTRKPVFLSVGFASLPEVDLAVRTLRTHGCNRLAVLHCVTGYSSEPIITTTNLRTIADIQERFHAVTGFSDNNAGIEIPVFAAGTGASVLEKHLILNKKDKSHDARFSITPSEMKTMVATIRRAEAARGNVHYGPASPAERYMKRFRRSIFAVQDIEKGQVMTSRTIRVIRPEGGLKPEFFSSLLGRRAVRRITRGTPLRWTHVK